MEFTDEVQKGFQNFLMAFFRPSEINLLVERVWRLTYLDLIKGLFSTLWEFIAFLEDVMGIGKELAGRAKVVCWIIGEHRTSCRSDGGSRLK